MAVEDHFCDLESDPGLEPMHVRSYEVRTYRVSSSTLRVRGVLSDRKPAGLYIPGDPAPLEVHRMVVDLDVTFPGLVIERALARIEVHPHPECPRIASRYALLEGVSVMRGFNAKIRELFGGSGGCTHTSALLQAMGPVIVQSTWPMRIADDRDDPSPKPIELTPQQRLAMMRSAINSCHVWREDGPEIAAIEAGSRPPMMLTVQERLVELGRKPSDWTSPMNL